MTQAIQVEAGTGALPAANRLPVQAASSGTGADNPRFAQLLAIAQNLSATGEQEQGASALIELTDSPPPEQQQPPSAGEIEQMVASLGLPLLTANTPSVQPTLLPEAHTPDAGIPHLPAQVVILPQVATDVPMPTNLPTDAKVEPETESVHQSPLNADSEIAPAVAPKASTVATKPTQPAQEMLTVAATPSPGEMTHGDITNPVQAVPSFAPEAQTLPKGIAETARPPSEGSAAAPAVHNPTMAQAQASHPGQMQSEERYERQVGTPAVSRGTRSQTRKPAAFEISEKPSSLRSPEAHLHGAQSVETASAVHRTPETVVQPSEVSPTEVVRQVAQQVETMVNTHNTSSVTLQLEPEHLGKLRVTISFSDGAIHTHIVADNHAVRQMLESNSALLQQALQERGLQLGALQVSVQGDGRQFLLHQPYPSPSLARGWLEAEPVWSTAETSFGRTTPGGINLLV